MARFIHNEKHPPFPKQEQDEERRKIIRKLLTQEEAKDTPRANPKDGTKKSKHP